MQTQQSNARAVTSLLFVAAMLAASPLGGCGMFSSGSSSSSSSSGSSSDAYTGEVTIENRSSLDVCRIEMINQDDKVAEDVQLGAGERATVAITSETIRFYVTECGGERTLYGHVQDWLGNPVSGGREYLQGLAQPTIVLYDEGAAPADATDHRAVELNPRSVSDWLFFPPAADATVAQATFDALNAHARGAGWDETFHFTIPATEWNVLRHRRTGVVMGRNIRAAGFATWPEGTCTMQLFQFAQQHDGSDFSGPIAFDGTSTQLDIPCAALEYARGVANGSASSAGSSSSPSGGMCTNTCASSNDGECDDGGPGSLYSVCGLGTDCADCGAR